MLAAPEGERRLSVAGRDIAYRLRRSARRTVGLTVDARGLCVAAPQRATLASIEALIREHGDWVLGKLDIWAERRARPPFEVRDGLVIFIAGEASTVKIDPQRRRGHLYDRGLRLLVLNGAQPPLEALLAALKAEARTLLAARLAVGAERFGVPLPPLRLSSARTRWGSCNHRGGIALNWRLLLMPLPVIDYVVAHELAHLKEMNHGPRFWSLVAALCPDWQARRAELKQRALSLPDL